VFVVREGAGRQLAGIARNLVSSIRRGVSGTVTYSKWRGM
jgi:hypothetical protein